MFTVTHCIVQLNSKYIEVLTAENKLNKESLVTCLIPCSQLLQLNLKYIEMLTPGNKLNKESLVAYLTPCTLLLIVFVLLNLK